MAVPRENDLASRRPSMPFLTATRGGQLPSLLALEIQELRRTATGLCGIAALIRRRRGRSSLCQAGAIERDALAVPRLMHKSHAKQNFTICPLENP
jgi:hypothetical protein